MPDRLLTAAALKDEMVQGEGLRLEKKVEGDTVEENMRPDKLSKEEERKGDVKEAHKHRHPHLKTDEDKEPDDRLRQTAAQDDEERVRGEKPMELGQIPIVNDAQGKLGVEKLHRNAGVDKRRAVEDANNRCLIRLQPRAPISKRPQEDAVEREASRTEDKEDDKLA